MLLEAQSWTQQVTHKTPKQPAVVPDSQDERGWPQPELCAAETQDSHTP
jgi:hypothetical protein